AREPLPPGRCWRRRTATRRKMTMGEYEPNDSRDVTLNPAGAPGEPPRTGPREGETRKQEEGEAPVRQPNIAQDTAGGGWPDRQTALSARYAPSPSQHICAK